MNFIKKILQAGTLMIMCFCLVSCKSKLVEVDDSNVEQLDFHDSEGKSLNLHDLNSEYTIIIKADVVKEIIMENISQLVEAFDISNIKFVFLWNEKQDTLEEVIKTNSYTVNKKMNLDYLSPFVLCSKDTVLLSTESIDDLIDELIQIVQNSSELETGFLQKLSGGKPVMESGSNTDEILYLFITEGCSTCEQVKEQILANSKLIDRFEKIIYVADHNSKEYFSDSFTVYGRYFSINEFPTILVYNKTSWKYEVNPRDVIEELE